MMNPNSPAVRESDLVNQSIERSTSPIYQHKKPNDYLLVGDKAFTQFMNVKRNSVRNSDRSAIQAILLLKEKNF